VQRSKWCLPLSLIPGRARPLARSLAQGFLTRRIKTLGKNRWLRLDSIRAPASLKSPGGRLHKAGRSLCLALALPGKLIRNVTAVN
jgi:hypothetical protein